MKIAKEQLQKIVDINNALTDTRLCGKYLMSYEVKCNGRWIAKGWGCPEPKDGAYIKTIKDAKYIYCQEGYVDYDTRYYITENVAEIFGW